MGEGAVGLGVGGGGGWNNLSPINSKLHPSTLVLALALALALAHNQN